MRSHGISARVRGSIAQFIGWTRFSAISRICVLILVLTAFGTTARGFTPDDPLADDPIDLSNVQTDDDFAAIYFAVSDNPDPEEAEARRQFILWYMWMYGHNPWKLDPFWVPPIP